MYQHLEALKQKLLSLNIETVPAPWKCIGVVPVGGLRSVGFDKESEHLLVVSLSGRGVIDCCTGEKVARKYDDFVEDEISLEIQGIGLLSNQKIRVARLFGGGLPNTTEDDWTLESVTINWPEQMIFLLPPNSTLYGSLIQHPDMMTKIVEYSELRAYGFSYTGRSFIFATTSDITIFSR